MFSVLFRSNLLKLVSSSIQRCISSIEIKAMDPGTYVESNKLQRKHVFDVIEEFKDDLKYITGKCMDVGCGPGDITKEIILPALNPYTVVIGTDISENMIDYAKKEFSVKKRLGYDVLDIQTKNLPIKYISEFDHICSFHTLHWCYDIRQAFENIYRMLRPNGTMLVYLVATHDIFEVFKHMAQDISFSPYIPDVNKYISPFHNSVNPRKDLKELLEKLGFTTTHCSLRVTYFTDESVDKFTASILSILKFLDEMPYDLKEKFKKDFTRQFREKKIYIRGKDEKTTALDLYTILLAFAQKPDKPFKEYLKKKYLKKKKPIRPVLSMLS